MEFVRRHVVVMSQIAALPYNLLFVDPVLASLTESSGLMLLLINKTWYRVIAECSTDLLQALLHPS